MCVIESIIQDQSYFRNSLRPNSFDVLYVYMNILQRFFKRSTLLLYVFITLGIINALLVVIVVREYQPTIEFYLHLNSKPSKEVAEILGSYSNKLSEEAFKELNQRSKILAKESDYLEIGDCIPRPFIMKATWNSLLKVRNSGDQIHSLSFGENITMQVKPGETKQILVDFSNYVPSAYPFGCDNSAGPAGILYITTN